MPTPERDQLKELLAGTDLHGTHQAQTMAYTSPRADRFGGTAVATRWPHRVVETLDLRVEGEAIGPWCALATVVEVPGEGEMLFIATTACARLNGTLARERQAVALTDLDARHRRALPTVMAGDFNANPDEASIRYLTGLQSLGGQSVFYHDAWALAGDGPGYTWTADNPIAGSLMDQIIRQPGFRMRIDYIFVGSAGFQAGPGGHAQVQNAALFFLVIHDPARYSSRRKPATSELAHACFLCRLPDRRCRDDMRIDRCYKTGPRHNYVTRRSSRSLWFGSA